MENCQVVDYEMSELSIEEWCQIAQNHSVSSDEMMDFLEEIVDRGPPLETAESVTVATSFQEELKNRGGLNCAVCGKVFTRKNILKRLMKIHAGTKEFQCSSCTKTFYRKDAKLRHENSCCRRKAVTEQLQKTYTEENTVQIGGGGGESVMVDQEEEERENSECESALNGNLKTIQMKPRVNEKNDLTLFLQGKRGNVLKNLEREFKEKRGVKWFITVRVKMVKYRSDGNDQFSEPFFRSNCQRLINLKELSNQYQDCVGKVTESFQAYQRHGSGWQLLEVLQLDLGVATYTPLQGSSFVKLPKELFDKKAILNIRNDDQKCFLWSLLAAIHPVKREGHPENVHHYTRYEQELNVNGIVFPMKVKDIPKVEKQNPTLSVNLFGYEEKELFPIYISEEERDQHVNLLLISNNDTTHYCLIRNLSRLLNTLTKSHGKRYYCNYCLHGFTRNDLLEQHNPYCGKNGPQKIKLPTEGNDVLYFKELHKQLKVPFVIYADFESILLPCKQEKLNEDERSYTQKTHEHQASGFCYVVVSDVEDFNTPPVVYRGENAVDKFLKCLLMEEKRISSILKQVVPMQLSTLEEHDFQMATHCHICEEELGTDRVRDHCHLTGKFRGAAHSNCNLNFKFTSRIPVVFHNLKNYDAHLIIKAMGFIKDRPISCIPTNDEKYISFSIGDLTFIDSLQFLNASLENLVSNLAKEGVEKFRVLKSYIEEEKVPLLLRKGVFPYEYFDSFEKFSETQLPAKSSFFNSLKDEHITLDDYHHAKNVFEQFGCRSLGDYHDLYVKSDVLLLADVFENFRDICLNYYQLDPAHFYTAPGLSFAACLKMTQVELELLTDIDMHLYLEAGLRGGVSVISNRYSRANNKYLEDFRPDEESKYIMYLDANNLYGWAMSQALPVDSFAWLLEEEFDGLDIMTVSDDNDTGYVLEVDLEYPAELHDLHSDFPLCPEKVQVTDEMLSPYCQQLKKKLNLKEPPIAKLVPNLYDKTRYILHYRNLKLYLSLGMKLTKIHRILSFQQSAWLKEYIDFNTEKRKHAANDFEKDFFKLMNNSVFGKTMENLRNRVDLKLVTTEKRLLKLTKAPSFDHFKIFTPEVAAVNSKKTTLYLNRPIYAGFAILELSKVLMFDFYYNYIKTKYGSQVKLLFTDTDSLCLEVKTDDIYADMTSDTHLFDFSEYPRDHFLHSDENKKVIGKFKDELKGIPAREFIGLRPKMYSLLYANQKKQIVEKKVAKGIAKNVTEQKIRHDCYKQCLFNQEQQTASMRRLQSFEHNIFSIKLNKIGLSPFDNKRFISSDGCHTFAYGHYSLKDSKLDDHDKQLIELLVGL